MIWFKCCEVGVKINVGKSSMLMYYEEEDGEVRGGV